MASVFKRNKKKKNAAYWIQYKDHDGRRRTVKGFTDKGLTEQLAAKLENEAMLRKSNLIDSSADELAKLKLSSLEEQISSYSKFLSSKSNSEKHNNLVLGQIRRTCKGCSFTTVGDIQVGKCEEFLHRLRSEKNLGHKTFNHYAQALQAFGSWLVSKRKLDFNPFDGIERLNTAVDVRHKRRALKPQEIKRLIDSARNSGRNVQSYDGELRAKLYTIAYFTGLRRKELASLQPSNFDLQSNPPQMVIEAACSKHRKQDVLPIHGELLVLLEAWLPKLSTDEYLFPGLAKKETWLMVKKDLERVGIPYRNKEGVADFHAAGRHTYITELMQTGASMPQVMELARHGDIRMTMRYTHVGIDEKAKALKGLPKPAPAANDNSPLHMRCIPSGSESPNMTPNVTGKKSTKVGETKIPRENPSRDASCHSPAQSGSEQKNGGDRNRTCTS